MEEILKKLNRFFYGKWNIGILDLKKGRWISEALKSNIPYFKAENANGRHIIMKPKSEIEPYYMLIDDITEKLINTQHRYSDGRFKPGRLIIETSPQNYQVWIHSNRALNKHEKLYWLKKLNNDPGSTPKNRWGRCPGFRNRKDKYCDSKGNYPLSKLIWIDWGSMAKIPQINSNQEEEFVHQKKETLPIIRSQYQRNSESETDFSYALSLMRRGYSDQEIEMRIREERSNWINHKTNKKKKHYLAKTIRSARMICRK